MKKEVIGHWSLVIGVGLLPYIAGDQIIFFNEKPQRGYPILFTLHSSLFTKAKR